MIAFSHTDGPAGHCLLLRCGAWWYWREQAAPPSRLEWLGFTIEGLGAITAARFARN